MMNLIAAALVAAAPVPPADSSAQHQQMGHAMGDMKPRMPAEAKDCCCKDMMAKMDAKHAEPGDQHR